MQIVADNAIAYLDQALRPFGDLRALPGRSITRSDVQDADALVVRSVTRVDEALVDGSRLRMVVSATAGIDHVDVPALEARGIRFEHAPGCNATAVVEYVVIAMLMTMTARAPQAGLPELLARLGMRPIGVVGFGHVGRRLTARLRSLGMEVLVCDPPLVRKLARQQDPPGPLEWRAMARSESFVSKATLLRRCGTITVHTPLITEGEDTTVGWLGADELDQLVDDALIINTCRGGVFDDNAVETWLDRDKGDAVIDVWQGEPNLRWSLVLHPRLRCATPHIAGYTLEGKVRATAAVVRHLADLQGIPPHWTGADELGDANTPTLLRGTSLLEQLLYAHPLDRDNESLRQLASLPTQQRAARFEQLRREYTFRREFDHFTGSENQIDPAGVDFLRRLGVC